jgi:hypothetical protein
MSRQTMPSMIATIGIDLGSLYERLPFWSQWPLPDASGNKYPKCQGMGGLQWRKRRSVLKTLSR